MEGQPKFFKEYSNLRRCSQFQPTVYNDDSTLKQKNMKPQEELKEELKGISVSWKMRKVNFVSARHKCDKYVSANLLYVKCNQNQLQPKYWRLFNLIH